MAGCGDSSTGPSLDISIEGLTSDHFLVGDQVLLDAALSDPSVPGTVSWSSSDTAVALVGSDGLLRAQRPGTARVSAKLKKASAEVLLTVVSRPGGYTADEIDYLQEIAFGFEYGAADEVIRKWSQNPRIQLFGDPTAEDSAEFEDVVSDLNLLMEEVQMEIVDSEPTVEIHFAKQADFPGILPSYVPGNSGYFTVWYDEGNRIYRSVVLVSTDGLDQEARSHIIREEVTQMLGLGKDSFSYTGSIFYQGWTTTAGYAPIDEAIIEMLYRPQLARGMGYRTAVDTLRTLTRLGWEGTGGPVQLPGTLSASSQQFDGPGPARTDRGGMGSGGTVNDTHVYPNR